MLNSQLLPKRNQLICLTVYFSWSFAGRGLHFISSCTAPKQNNHFISSSMKVISIYLGEIPVQANLRSAVGLPLFSALFGYCLLEGDSESRAGEAVVILMNGGSLPALLLPETVRFHNHQDVRCKIKPVEILHSAKGHSDYYWIAWLERLCRIILFISNFLRFPSNWCKVITSDNRVFKPQRTRASGSKWDVWGFVWRKYGSLGLQLSAAASHL